MTTDSRPRSESEGESPEESEELVWTADAGGAAVGFSGRWSAVTGTSAAASLGRGWLDALHPDDREPVERAWREALSRGKTFAIDARLRCGSGGARPVRARATPIRDAEGAVDQWVVVMTDRGDRPRAAAGRRGQADVERLAAIAAHDLQEPLRKIAAFGGRLAARWGPELDPQGRDQLARMIAAAGRMRGLIDGLLAVSRASGRGRPMALVDLSAVAAEVVDDLEDLIARTGGRVEVGPLPAIRAEPTQMRQLLQNLIANALKFHRDGRPPLVRVSARAVPGEDSAAPACLLEVADDGVGFDESHLGRIFRPFERLHGRDAFEGAGMGLAICREIVEGHSGRITATSTPGEGSTFRVALPIQPPSPGTEPMPHAAATPLARPADANARGGRSGGRDV